jgi:hypothetical protein
MSMEQRLAILEQEVRRLKDIEAIKQLRWEYSRACDDDHNPDRLVPMFAADACIVLNPPFSGEVRGHAALREMFANNARINGITWTLHYYLQPLITVADDGRSAKATWYLWELAKMPDAAGGEEPVWVAGEYFDDYVKQDGLWKFQRIDVHVRLLSPYQDGWVKTMVRGVHPPRAAASSTENTP